MRETEEDLDEQEAREERGGSQAGDSNDGTNPSTFDEEDLDPFHSSLFGGNGPMGLQNTLRALSGMMSGMSSRLREMLVNLRAKDDPSLQLIALQELSDLLLVSNEDNLSGQFAPDPYVKELVTLMQPNQFGEENPEIMLLACRCLANLMEALRGSVANVVYGGAVPILCQKLLDIQFIDLAEQALSVGQTRTRSRPPSACQTDNYDIDSSQDLGRLPCFNCARGGLDSVLDVLGFLSDKHSAYSCDNCCQLLS